MQKKKKEEGERENKKFEEERQNFKWTNLCFDNGEYDTTMLDQLINDKN